MAVLNLPDNIELADTKFNEPSEIDVLLGASVFYDVLGKREKRLGKQMPILREAKLGWIIAGPIGYSNAKRVVCNLSITNEDLHNEVKRFWIQEEIQNKEKNNTKVEKEVESHFLATYQRLDDGRFEVKLPFKTNVTELGYSVQNATKRFESLEKRLKRDPELKVEYCKFMKEYQILGHMSEIDLELENEKTRNFYLPHHCVQKETSSTTKLRVVFDASAKSTSGLSLNDVLKTGPVIQSDLFAIITNFRKYNVVIIGDIEKMYRQIQVAANDREFQQILWRSEPGEELKHYRLNTVTYGTAPVSYLACRALYQLGIENEKGFPEASKAIKFNFYMDDLMTGADNTESALKLKSEITNILQTGGFKLRKWNSNQAELLTDVVGDNKLEYEIAEGNDVRVLGLVWNPLKDCFSYSVKLNKPSIVTKRFILSTIARIFDPLGLINPIIVKSKLILQKLWREKIDWDEDVPPDIVKIWEPFYDSLIELNSIIIPHKVVGSDYDNVEIHGFSDASELAFGACVYIRTSNKGEHVTRLLCAKSKVAPLRKITLPRLELNGALLLARLVNKVKRDFDLDMHKGILWTDSTIVLSWLAAEPCTWNTYVANRVTEIQDLSKSFEWRHIPSAQNPADILSRGSYPSNLLDNNLWWNGPKFLTTENYLWPDNIVASDHELPERKTVKLCTLTTINFDYFFERFSSFTRLHRVFAYILRFLNGCRAKHKIKVSKELSLIELNTAMVVLMKLIQSVAFANEIKYLKANKPIPRNSNIISLNVFLDEEELLRVGGRIMHSNERFDKRHPILLPYNHKFTRLLVEYEHKRNLHAGQQAVLAAIRMRFWPIRGKSVVKNVLSKCIVCFKSKPKGVTPLMGDLPKTRLTPVRPFSIVGVDYAGPILLKDSILRNRKFVKGYLCIFVCFVTKAIHIELAVDLTTQAFLNCLKRFVSRRGLCSEIYSDNGTNFVGASNELRKIVNELQEYPELHNYLLENSIKWNFNAPFSPHQGGLWETAVKSTKFHLNRIIGNSKLTYECLCTILCQVEAILNSRPLLPLSQDPEDLTALTPAHFLIGDTLTAIPQMDITSIPSNRLKSYQQLQQMLQHFLRRWSSEYITSLQQRTKWKLRCSSLQLGDMVLIREDNTPPLCWKLGRVTQLYPGQDGITRVVSVHVTKGAVIKRSVVKLCKLPLDDDL